MLCRLGDGGGDRFVQGTEIMSGELVVNNETIVTTELTGSVDGVPVITGTAWWPWTPGGSGKADF